MQQIFRNEMLSKMKEKEDEIQTLKVSVPSSQTTLPRVFCMCL